MAKATLSIEAARQQLHEIIRGDVPFEEKARDTLELGTQFLGADNGHLTRIDEETNYWEAIVTTDTTGEHLPPERELNLLATYCREPFNDDTTFTLHDAPNQGWADDPAFETSDLHAYLGVPLVVNDATYGTVCFVAEDPRSEEFSEVEVRFAEHLALLLERELEREHVETELTNQTNVATVLNRVLRHNLRNDMSVIRGYTELLAEQLGDDTTVETVLDHIDDLLELSQKARDLERIVSDSSERRHTELGPLIEEIADEIVQDHPTASIAVEYDAEIYTDVLQNFDRAVEELIENAIEHSGNRPTVTVTVDRVPNAVEIQIIDDGPGLPESEFEVLETGEETPLIHGSGLGLWLAYWIVTSHDGSLEPTVTENGTTMTISLPRKHDVGVQEHLTELSRSRDKYKATVENAHDAMVIADDEGRFIEVNESASDLFGMPSDKLLGREIAEFAPEKFDFEQAWQQFKTADEKRGTFPLVGPDGSERIVEYAATPNIVPGEHLSILRDVTARKEREQQIRKLKQRLDLAIESADIGVWEWETNSNIIHWDESMERLLGLEPDSFQGTYDALLERVHPDDVDDIESAIDPLLETGGKTTYSIRMETASGEYRWIETRLRVVTDENGEPARAVGVGIDITDRIE